MQYLFTIISICFCLMLYGQERNNPTYFSVEGYYGITADSNTNFPKMNGTASIFFGIGKKHTDDSQEWAYRLGKPKTAINLGFTNYGNPQALGQAFTFLPTFEIDLSKKEPSKFTMGTGLGASYFTKKFDAITNPLNQAVSTDVTWTFRLYFYYSVLKTERINWRIGGGYLHHSNGHTRLPNNGYNTILGGISAEIYNKNTTPFEKFEATNSRFSKKTSYYFSTRAGYAINALSLIYNDKKPVYTVALSAGKTWNKTYRLGVGFAYRYYQHYYDYINDNESLVQDGREFEDLKQNTTWNASNINLFVEGEILLNHFGISMQVGANIHKPAYDIDWRINEGWDNTPREIPENWVLGEFTTKYQLKKLISTRLGLRYYLFGNETNPTHNIYASATINANLGQADFTEVSIGYLYSFDFIE